MSNVLKIRQHLFQIYPNMPRYAADPSQSDIIKIYQFIMLRFAGHYGRQPLYFVKAPLCPLLFGDRNQYINLSKISICSSQNVIIAISSNQSKKIRLNNYQTTLYGQLELPIQIQQWKFKISQNDQLNQENKKNQYSNLVLKILKAFVQLNSIKQLKNGMDILIYKDFIQDQFLYSKQSFIYGLYTAIHACLLPKISLQQKILHKAYQKIGDQNSKIKSLPQICNSQFNKITLFDNEQKPKYINIPQGYSFVIADSMTPLPKKLIKGKRFNLRQCQIQIGIQLIMAQLGFTKQIRSLNELMQTMGCDINEILDSVQSIIPNKILNVEDIQTLTQKSLIDILKHIPYANNVIDQNCQFNPYKRLKYFINEQKQINQIENNPENIIKIMEQSSKNQIQLLQIGSQQIKQLLQATKPWIQAYKIIGNGWGGNILIICKDQKLQSLCEDLVNKFYLSESNKILLSDDIETYLRIIGKPQTGLSILNPENQIWFG